MVDLHAHLPQVPNAGVGFALDLLTWLDRVTFPTEQSWSDPEVAERLAPAIFEAFAAAGTTTVLAYGVVYEAAMDAAFRAAEANGIRAILGKVMMDRGTYDPRHRAVDHPRPFAARIGRPDRRAGTAPTAAGSATRSRPASRSRAAPRCCANRRRSRRRPARGGRPTSARTRSRSPRWPDSIPDALDYVDVYDRAGGLGARTVLAHADPPVGP